MVDRITHIHTSTHTFPSLSIFPLLPRSALHFPDPLSLCVYLCGLLSLSAFQIHSLPTEVRVWPAIVPAVVRNLDFDDTLATNVAPARPAAALSC